MTYVDLNPIRAQLAKTPEESDFTSIRQRISDLKSNNSSFLAPFTGDEKNEITAGVPYHLLEYIELVDWTAREIRKDKRDSIDSSLPPILVRLGLDPSDWITFATEIEAQFGNWVGSPQQFSDVSGNVGQNWISSSVGCRSFY